ncbi:hypothetical protein XFF6994_2340008 [Xanthomonas citri pv. fuscans]|nr:hypothetical protein XFF6994_2340008 [Xanthomonas citri pv. fuscans]
MCDHQVVVHSVEPFQSAFPAFSCKKVVTEFFKQYREVCVRPVQLGSRVSHLFLHVVLRWVVFGLAAPSLAPERGAIQFGQLLPVQGVS